ncbi:unnamed protein product, partial [Allacma fusca]
FLYNEPVELKSVDTALATLQAADKYFCCGLARVCISFLSDNLNQNNVLAILKFIRVYCGDYQNLENLAKEKDFSQRNTGGIAINENCVIVEVAGKDSSKESGYLDGKLQKSNDMSSGETDCMNPDQLESIEMECAGLLHKCLLFVDGCAETILASEEMEDLDVSTVGLILGRDTLNVEKELLVFSALMRWADKECKRQQLPLTPSSKRQVLAEKVFLPRYLTMSLSEFQSSGGPANSGVFTNEELWAFTRILKEDLITISMTSPNCGTVDNEKIKKLVVLTASYTPLSLHPFVQTLVCPRTPLSKPGKSKTGLPSKKKRLTMLERWLCVKRCCKTFHSNPSSPLNSNASSPIRRFTRANGQPNNHHCCEEMRDARIREQIHNHSPNHCRSTETSTLNNAIERVIICWAFFFD